MITACTNSDTFNPLVKRNIDEVFTKRYNNFEKYANSILKRLKLNKTNTTYDLISEAYEYIVNNSVKLAPNIITGQTEAIIINWMKFQICWTNTGFKKNYIYNQPTHEVKVFDSQSMSYVKTKLPLFRDSIEKYSGGEDSELDGNLIFSLSFPEELITRDDQIEELLAFEKQALDTSNKFQAAYESLTGQQRALFDIAFNKGHNTTDKLFRYLKDNGNKESRVECWRLLKELKQTLKNKMT